MLYFHYDRQQSTSNDAMNPNMDRLKKQQKENINGNTNIKATPSHHAITPLELKTVKEWACTKMAVNMQLIKEPLRNPKHNSNQPYMNI